MLRADDKSLEIELRGFPLSMANALRRHLINEVPTMAVEEVMVIENTSSVYNEVLAHRISLIPFRTDLDHFVLPEECNCGNRLGCERCVVRFSLRARAVSEVVTVYSREMVRETGTEAVEPVSGDFPIVKLAPGQTIELELYVRLGTSFTVSKTKHVSVLAMLFIVLSRSITSLPTSSVEEALTFRIMSHCPLTRWTS